MSENLIFSRLNHTYTTERVTPVEEIPEEFQQQQSLPGGGVQITDRRLCYNWKPGDNGGRYVECGSVAGHAEQDGFSSPENK